MDRYKCHKVVEAGLISRIDHNDNGASLLLGPTLQDRDPERVQVTHAYLSRHMPRIGGYFVRYDDGYESWSPADAFEAGYSILTD